MYRVGLLTSGGDSPGTNAVIEAVVRHAAGKATILGIRDGFRGLVAGELDELTPAQVDGISARGGTILGTSRDRILQETDGISRVQRVLWRSRLDALLLLGGGGSIQHGAAALQQAGLTVAAIPCTIDNDVPFTDRTVGFDTACNRAVALADGIGDTGRALPGRIFMLETLGGTTGHIAVAVAAALRADAVLVPEWTLEQELLSARLAAAVKERGYGLAVASEGAGNMTEITQELATSTQHRTRLTSLGHAQRGGSPSWFDRWLARAMGEQALDLLRAGRSGFMSAYCSSKVRPVPLEQLIGAAKELDVLAYRALNGLDDPA